MDMTELLPCSASLGCGTWVSVRRTWHLVSLSVRPGMAIFAAGLVRTASVIRSNCEPLFPHCKSETPQWRWLPVRNQVRTSLGTVGSSGHRNADRNGRGNPMVDALGQTGNTPHPPRFRNLCLGGALRLNRLTVSRQSEHKAGFSNRQETKPAIPYRCLEPVSVQRLLFGARGGSGRDTRS